MGPAKSPLVVALLGTVGFFLIGIVFGFGHLFMMGTVLGRRGLENVVIRDVLGSFERANQFLDSVF